MDFEGVKEEVAGLDGVAEDVVVVDIVNFESGIEGGGLTLVAIFGERELGLAFLLLKIGSDLNKAFSGDLDCAEVDVCADEAAAQFHGDGLGSAGAHEAVEDDVAGIGGSFDYSLNKGLWLLSWVTDSFLSLRIDCRDI